MARLEELARGASVKGVLPDGLVTVVDVKWHGSDVTELIYKDAAGKLGSELLYRDREPTLVVASAGVPWSFDGDGALFRLVSEAHRIRLAHLFDPVLAVHTSIVEPLPHQITAVYDAMLGRQPLRFLLADDPGAGKTIMAGLLVKELIARGDLQRCLVVCPGSLAEQWQDELYRRFHLPFEILTNDKLEAARTGNWFLETNLVIARLDKLSRNEDVQEKLKAPDCRWDLVICDEAHKMAASYFGGEIKYTKRYRLGQLLSTLTRHFLLLTATPHNGKEEEFQLFMALLDGDRFEGRFRDGVHVSDVSDLMRRMVKENLLKFDATPLFPERIAYTVSYKLSDAEAQLYKAVTDYVTQEFNRAEALQNDKRAGTVGFALTILQRRLASSPEAIYQSLRRRRERLESRLRELELLQRGGQATPEVAAAAPALDADDVEDLEDAPENEVAAAEEEYGPSLILIDEWVAYARQLHDQSDLPAGSFETHFTFAQALTESAKAAKQCLLVISLPASDTSGSPHAVAEDVEVGGERGRAALDRLRNAVGRVESSWRPASAEESFEIVRRRLFEPLVEKTQFVARDTVAQAFFDLYRTQQQEFPAECHNADYEKRLKGAYPIHPEIFDRLYGDWSTLVKFQRTRGVLRLMAAVIHSLWEKGDRNPLILPANIPIEDHRVQFELTRYLSDNWVPVIERDVDGPNALPLRLDGEVPNLGKYAACRRVARTVYLGSAPTATAANRGIEDRRIRLGCVMPGETPAIFGDALRRLAAAATYLYQDGARYWYSTQPTVTKVADDRAEQLKRNPDAVAKEIEKRVRADIRKTGDFTRVHPMPQSSQDVPDDRDARLIVLGIDHPYSRESGSRAEVAAKAILESRGNTPRLFRNTLAFLAVDQARLQDLDEAVRRYLAWESILTEQTELDLSPHQVKQAENQKDSADVVVTARLPEAYQWLLVPVQSTPQGAIEWQGFRLNGQGPLAERASKKLRNDALLYTSYAGTLLRMELDRVPLWRGDHVAIKQLTEDFARYLYLPRLKEPDVLFRAIRDGLGLLTWTQDSFAYADSFDEALGRYRGLRCGQIVSISESNSNGLLVKAEPALRQQEAETRAAATSAAGPEATSGTGPQRPGQPVTGGQAGGDQGAREITRPKRFHGSVALDPTRVGRDAGRIADEVIAHLAGLVGAFVKVTLEIEAEVPNGTPDNVVRIVTENSRTLKFASHGFEKD